MFDISLGELAVVGAVALVVLGPEKLPKVARAAGLMLGRAQRMAADFRTDLERDLQSSELAELGKQVAEEENQLREQLAATTASVHQSLADIESSHYGDGDPELDALEHRRYGGQDDESELKTRAVDSEQDALDRLRYGEEEETLTALSTAGAVEPVVETEQALPSVSPQQPDLFVLASTEPAVAQKEWRDRR